MWFDIIKSEEFLNRLADVARRALPNANVEVENVIAARLDNVGGSDYQETGITNEFLSLTISLSRGMTNIVISVQETGEETYTCILSMSQRIVNAAAEVTANAAKIWLEGILQMVG
jgi:hypothetical protein